MSAARALWRVMSIDWARLKANDSLECRNCHAFEYMDFTRQSPRASQAHSRFLPERSRTCIDCHKGIAHRLPAMPASRGDDAGERLVSLPGR